MKILEAIVEFVFSIIKKAILTGIISMLILFALLVFAIFVPEQVINAFQILKSLVGA